MYNYNIHTRSSYTFFNSLLKIKDIIDYSINNNLSNAFLIDKNYMHGAMEFYKLASEKGLKPILGLEIDYKDCNKILIAKNYKGYQELMEISSRIGLGEELEIKKSSNLIETTKNYPIISFIKKQDKETLKMFASVSNIDINDNHSHFLNKDDYDKEQQKEIENIIESVDLKIKKQFNILPNYIHLGKEVEPKSFLKKLLNEKLRDFIISNKIVEQKKYKDRIKYEYSIIDKMGFDNYFLIVWDIVKFAKDNLISVGPGRGSVGGSLIAFILNITTIDPIKHNLLFERFLNEERISMPDIDLDFDDKRRDEIIQYIYEKYGADRVAQIITFQTLRARMSIKDIARIKGVSISEAEKLSKSVPEGVGLTESYKTIKNFKLMVDSSEENKEIFTSAKLIEGLPRQHSTHAAGIVLSPINLSKNVPIQKGYNNLNLTQYSMEWMEINGLLKIDILGLRNLSFMDEIINSIDEKIDVNKIPLDKKEVYDLLSKGMTAGIFQLESPGMTKVLKEMKPNTFEDIVATTSLFRPGPMKQIPLYIERKNSTKKINYLSKNLESILKNTYGIIVYQEQIMEIAQKFSGLSLAKADILRRAIGKKDFTLIQSIKEEFIKGSLKNQNDLETTEKIYDLIFEFSEYGFNRSHAFSYSIISYQLAYLKANYPKEFMNSLLNSVIGNSDKTTKYINEAKKMKIKILKPSINDSLSSFSLSDGKIMFGFLSIKGVGVKAANEILDEREKGIFKSYINAVIRLSIRKISTKNIELLIKAGAFDEFDLSRSKMLYNLELVFQYLEMIKIKEEEKISFDFTIANEPILKEPEQSIENSEYDIEAFGFIISEHPFSKIKKQISKIASFTNAEDVPNIQDKNIYVAGVINSARKITTKSNLLMAFLSIADDTGSQSITLWPGTYKKFQNDIKVGSVIYVIGKVDIKRNKTIIANDIKVVKK